MTRVDDREARFSNWPPSLLFLLGRIDTEPREVPVRERRMTDIHLLQDREHIPMRCSRENGHHLELDATPRWPLDDGRLERIEIVAGKHDVAVRARVGAR